jgi:cell division protein FtsB
MGDMKIAAAIVLSIVLFFIGTQIVSSIKEERSLAQNFADVESRLQDAQTKEQALSTEVNYLSDPANLEKELRSRFNYAKPGETMIIIVQSSTPAAATATTTGN